MLNVALNGVKSFEPKNGVTKPLSSKILILEMPYPNNNNLRKSKKVSTGIQDFVNIPLLIVQNCIITSLISL